VEITRKHWSLINSLSTHAWGLGGVFETEVLEQRPGVLVFRANGSGAGMAYRNESGGHCWHQVPPNDDRVHTSIITVAVLREPEESELTLHESDLEYQATRGSGAGGQNRNKVSSAIILTHKPTGTMVRCETERDQHKNKRLALSILRAKLLSIKESTEHVSRNKERKDQLGVGSRADKRRTIRTQHDVVDDHILGKKMRFRDYEKGNWKW
jgi:peptide chain release factor 1